jgi:hypothetical protein
MDRRLSVLNAEEFKGAGIFLYCMNEEMQGMDEDEVRAWLGKPKKITFQEAGCAFSIEDSAPATSLIGKVAVMLKVRANEVPAMRYSVAAVVE